MLVPFVFVKFALYITAAVLAAVAVGFLVAMLVTQEELDATRGLDRETRQQFREEVARLSSGCCRENISVPTEEPAC